MKNNKIIILITISFYFLILFGCKNNQTNSGIEELSIDTHNLNQNEKYSDCIDDVKYIPLESIKDNLIGNIDKILLHNDIFYIFDFRKAKTLFRFSINGKFVGKVSRAGKGPDEFMDPVDFTIEPSTSNIVILDRSKLIYYQPDGKFIKSIKLPFSAYKFEFIDSDNIAFSTGNFLHLEDLIISNNKGQIKTKYFPYNEATTRILNAPFQKLGESELLYFKNLDYTIYRIKKSDINPYRRITFGSNQFSDDDIESLKKDRNRVNNYYRIKYYNETLNHIFILSLYQKNAYFSIYSKQTQKTTTYATSNTINDISYTKTFPANLNYGDDGRGISCIEPYDLDHSALEKSTNNVLKIVVEKIKENDNPILMLIKYK